MKHGPWNGKLVGWSAGACRRSLVVRSPDQLLFFRAAISFARSYLVLAPKGLPDSYGTRLTCGNTQNYPGFRGMGSRLVPKKSEGDRSSRLSIFGPRVCMLDGQVSLQQSKKSTIVWLTCDLRQLPFSTNVPQRQFQSAAHTRPVKDCAKIILDHVLCGSERAPDLSVIESLSH
jgi:hypothetical protein